jgi:hypothetical protein
LKFNLYLLELVYVPLFPFHLGCPERILRLQPVPSGHKSFSYNDEEHVFGVFPLEDADVHVSDAYVHVFLQGQLLVQLVRAVLITVV